MPRLGLMGGRVLGWRLLAPMPGHCNKVIPGQAGSPCLVACGGVSSAHGLLIRE